MSIGDDRRINPSDGQGVADEKVNILLVDDQPAKLLSYEIILRELGHNLIKAASAREALAHLLKKEIAVILIDVVMPDLDGFELAAMIRGHPRFEKTAIIFVSAVALTEIDLLKGYGYGAVDYLPVPFVPNLLRAKVRVFVELYRKTRQLETLNAELERRVAERTAELAESNAELERRVEERTRERETALAQVHEMQKLESLGQLTGGLAHDFNNLLMAILSNLDLHVERLPENSADRRLVHAAIQTAERGAALTKRLLAFARRQELKPEPVDVGRLVGEMSEMLRRSLGPSVVISADFAADLALVEVDRNQLELALLNLALNARDAMPDGGRLSFAARSARVTSNARGLKPGDYVEIVVTDTGAGMDEATLQRASEPFFTTKGLGKGTGLGLSAVHGLAAQSGGGMRISSKLGEGTKVELWLPAVKSSADAQVRRPIEAAAAGPMRALSVLLVDDDPMVATSTAEMVEHLGHRVLVASSAARALDAVRGASDFDVLITDHAMPNMTGVELAKEVRKIRPGLPLILATGYADLPGDIDPAIRRLAKPYRAHDLAALLANLSGTGRNEACDTLSAAKRA
ncbi:MAG TPA: response regulator [Stellaceae bacterium]|nr:response regulator [Stellaceae bacterium]